MTSAYMPRASTSARRYDCVILLDFLTAMTSAYAKSQEGLKTLIRLVEDMGNEESRKANPSHDHSSSCTT